jgi:CheY-like chemotaxis protein
MNILIIDDDLLVRKALSHYLLESSHTVSVASNGQEGLELIQKQRDVDLIICDVMMPVLTGPSFILQLKNYFTEKHPSVIIISGVKIDEDFLKKIEIPYDHFISKPIDFSKLSQVIDRVETAEH